MDFDFDSSWILYGSGALTAIMALGFFGAGKAFNFSPETKSVVLLLVSAAFMVSGVRFNQKIISSLFFLLSAVSYIIFSLYLSNVIWEGPESAIISLGLIAIVFIGLGWLKNKKNLSINRKKFLWSIGGVLIIASGFIGLDVTGAQPNYQIELEEEVNISDDLGREETKIGVVKASNDFIFSRSYEEQNYGVCVFTPEERNVHLDQEPSSYDINRLKPGETLEIDLSVDIHVARDENVSIGGSYKIEQMDDCPEASDDKKIVVFETEDTRYRGIE